MTNKEYYDKVDAIHSQVEELIMQAENAYDEGYAKAVDEFAKKCKEKVMQTQISRLEWFEIDEIARELKTARGSE